MEVNSIRIGNLDISMYRAFYILGKIKNLERLALLRRVLNFIVGHGRIQFQWRCHYVEVQRVWCRLRTLFVNFIMNRNSV